MPSGAPLGNQNARKKRKPTNPRGNPNIAQASRAGAGAPLGNTNGFVHGLSLIKKNRHAHRLPRGKDKRFKQALLDDLLRDAGGADNVTAAKRLQAEIIATDAVYLLKMDRAMQRVLRLAPKYHENVAALAKLDSYRRPIINSLSANLDRFGFDKIQPPPKSLDEILAESEPETGDQE